LLKGEGINYQPFIRSILEQYVTGQLIDKEEALKFMALQKDQEQKKGKEA